MKEARPNWSPVTKITISLLTLALGIYLLFRFSIVLAPFVLAVILAYILSPLVGLLERRLALGRGLATLIAYLFLAIVLLALLMLIIPSLMAQVAALNLDIQRLLLDFEALLGEEVDVFGQVINVEDAFQQIVLGLEGVLEPFFGQTLGFVLDVISSLVWVVFIVVISFYLIKDGQKLRDWMESLVPPPYRMDFIRLREEIGSIWGSFFRGQLVLALVVASTFSLACFILGLPFALAMGVFAGLLEFLPSIGHGIWLSVASLLAITAGSTWLPIPKWAFLLLVMSLHIIFQQFDLNYLIPRIIGRRVHLPPLVVILGIVAGTVLAGVLGILLAAPTIASARVLGRYVYANLFDLDPFPVPNLAPDLPPPNPRWWRRKRTV